MIYLEPTNVVVLSPHLDDAVFSCAEHILNWKKQKKCVTIINFFSSFSSSFTPAYSLRMVKDSGYNTLAEFSRGRLAEDVAAMKELGVNFFNCNFTDGGFRSIGKSPLYPSSKHLFSGKISNRDYSIQTKIRIIIKQLSSKFTIFVCPIGIGNHADHLLVKQVGESLLSKKQLLLLKK